MTEKYVNGAEWRLQKYATVSKILIYEKVVFKFCWLIVVYLSFTSFLKISGEKY